jgi:hypothetical protein
VTFREKVRVRTRPLKMCIVPYFPFSILHIPPIDSPVAGVRAAIVEEHRSAMKTASIVFAIAALIAGLIAATCWWFASRLIVPIPMQTRETDDGSRHYGPVDPHLSPERWIQTIQHYVLESGKLNARAAVWTAWAVLLGAIASLAGALSN